MDTARIREAVRRAGGRAKIEISGGVTLDRVPELAETGADLPNALRAALAGLQLWCPEQLTWGA